MYLYFLYSELFTISRPSSRLLRKVHRDFGNQTDKTDKRVFVCRLAVAAEKRSAEVKFNLLTSTTLRFCLSNRNSMDLCGRVVVVGAARHRWGASAPKFIKLLVFTWAPLVMTVTSVSRSVSIKPICSIGHAVPESIPFRVKSGAAPVGASRLFTLAPTILGGIFGTGGGFALHTDSAGLFASSLLFTLGSFSGM